MNGGLLGRLERFARFLEDCSVVLILLTMVSIAGAQIVLRNFFDSGFAWGDELLRILVLWVGLVGAVVASREKRHVKIDILSRFLNPTGKRVAEFITHLFTSAVCLIVAWHAWVFVQGSIEFKETVLGQTPAWIFQSILPIAFGLIGYRYAVFALKALLGKDT